jgi:hypothetical protein
MRCRSSAGSGPPGPNARASLAEAAATEYRAAPSWLLGLGTRFHAVPCQCRISVSVSLISPTAQSFVLDVMATAVSARTRARSARGNRSGQGRQRLGRPPRPQRPARSPASDRFEQLAAGELLAVGEDGGAAGPCEIAPAAG